MEVEKFWFLSSNDCSLNFFIVFAVNLSVFADEDKLSLSLLNAQLKKNYAFVERSLNQSAMKIDNSSGKIFF